MAGRKDRSKKKPNAIWMAKFCVGKQAKWMQWKKVFPLGGYRCAEKCQHLLCWDASPRLNIDVSKPGIQWKVLHPQSRAVTHISDGGKKKPDLEIGVLTKQTASAGRFPAAHIPKASVLCERSHLGLRPALQRTDSKALLGSHASISPTIPSSAALETHQ